MVYPNSFWVKKEDMDMMEAVRLAGIFISMGRPPKAWEPMFEVYRTQAAKLLARVASQTDDGLRWLPENAFVGVSGDDVKSLLGLRAAVLRPYDVLWGNEGELVADTYLVGRGVQVNGGEIKVSRLVTLPPPTHPVTVRNVGRPPPTVRWTPAKPPRVYKTLVDRMTGFMRQAGEIPWEMRTEYSYDESISENNPTYDSEEEDEYGSEDFFAGDYVERLRKRDFSDDEYSDRDEDYLNAGIRGED
jgi:hypothetical protein